jgi:hypothetical protein
MPRAFRSPGSKSLRRENVSVPNADGADASGCDATPPSSAGLPHLIVVRFCSHYGLRSIITPRLKCATGLVWREGCQGFSLLAISLFGRAATSPRPDLLFARLLRGATVKGGRRPSRKRLALDGREHSGRLARSGWQLRRSEGSSPCARRSRATNLYSADPRGSQP